MLKATEVIGSLEREKTPTSRHRQKIFAAVLTFQLLDMAEFTNRYVGNTSYPVFMSQVGPLVSVANFDICFLGGVVAF